LQLHSVSTLIELKLSLLGTKDNELAVDLLSSRSYGKSPTDSTPSEFRPDKDSDLVCCNSRAENTTTIPLLTESRHS